MFIPLKDENPAEKFPLITTSLLAINCLLFIYQALSPQGLEYYVLKFGIIPYEITHWDFQAAVPRIAWPLSLLTGMFLHGSLWHLGGNMLYLWIFGNNVCRNGLCALPFREEGNLVVSLTSIKYLCCEEIDNKEDASQP